MTVKISALPAASDIASGDVVPIVQSGVTKKFDMGAKLDGLTDFYTVTVAPADWSGTNSPPVAPFTAVKTVSGLLSTDVPVVDLDMSSVAIADVQDVLDDFALVYRVESSADDELTIYALDEPTETLELTVQVVR